MHIYADRIDDLSGPGEPRPGPLPSIMSPEVFAEGKQDGTIVAGADLELLAKLQPGAHILVVPGSPTADWAAEAAAKLGPDTRIDLIGDVSPQDRDLWTARIEEARASKNPVALADVKKALRIAAHSGLQIPRNGELEGNSQIRVDVGRPMEIVRDESGRYNVTLHDPREPKGERAKIAS
ncbi:MAG: hypothetical protein EOP08_02810 [Proteobacteria bacterium]|nr:MAG: hypothetical protein EOP08_02810 [Pseudomonadota bacterium]